LNGIFYGNACAVVRYSTESGHEVEKSMKWRWIIVQVIVPIFGPIVLSLLFAIGWSTGANGFEPDFRIIIDITPRALTFYCLVLISMTMSGFWPRLGDNPVVGGTTIMTGVLVAVYYAFTVVWRHDPDYVPNESTYLATVVLAVASVVVSHMCHRRSHDDQT